MLAEEYQYYQADLFERKTELDVIREQMHNVYLSGEKVRRGVFARINVMGKAVSELTEKLDQIDRRLGMLERNL